MPENLVLKSGMEFEGEVDVITSKSELHRLLICAALSDKKSVIKYNSDLSEDINATISCLTEMGCEISVSGNELRVNSNLTEISDKKELFCNESGSLARFIIPIASLICKKGTVISGAGKLPQRPFSDLCRCLEEHGAKFSSHSLPMVIENKISDFGTFSISGDVSSQYLTGLLLMLPLCKAYKIELTTPLKSSGYVDITIDVMRKFGVNVIKDNNTYAVCNTYKVQNEIIAAGGDWSNAAFFLCGAKNKELKIKGLDVNSSQPDRKILDILKYCGMNIIVDESGIKISRKGSLVPFDIDCDGIPDLVPILSVFAATINGVSRIRNIGRLRFKESDRVESVCKMITALGGIISLEGESLVIYGVEKLKGGIVDSFNDHRIAMSAAVASLFCENNVEIKSASAVNKSYPAFFEEFSRLTGDNK